MSGPIVYGFPRSTFVNIVRLILTHKDVAYQFHDLEPVMGKPDHLALHPFNRVPILSHGDLTIYETSAIAAYVDEAFGGVALTPKDIKAPGPHEPVDQRGQFLLLPLHDLPRDA
ncbi:glutathione S-transferase [Bradyrhizobium sp. JR6.1]